MAHKDALFVALEKTHFPLRRLSMASRPTWTQRRVCILPTSLLQHIYYI